MTKLRVLAAVALLALFGTATESRSATLIVSSGQLLGASDVLVEGAFYDVEFLSDFCTVVFTGCNEVSDFAFSTETSARNAAQALLEQVFLNVALGSFDTQPALTNGCSYSGGCNALIPYAIVGSNYRFITANNRTGVTGDSVQTGNDFSQSTALGSALTYARFTAHAVPEPATLALFSIGLVGLARARRRWTVLHMRQSRCSPVNALRETCSE